MLSHKLNGNGLGFYITLMAKWLSVSLIVGATGGFIGSLFVLGVNNANEVWFFNRELTFFLPVVGLIIVAMYGFFKFDKIKGTNRIIEKVRAKEELPVVVGPLIFISTLLTHLFGGSAGREGAAVQLGGSIGAGFAKYFKVDEKDTSLIVLSGVSAVFSSLFSTPVTAVFFALEVISVGVIYYSGLIPCLVSSLTAYGISYAMGITEAKWDFVQFPKLEFDTLVLVAIIGIMSALMSVLIVITFSNTKKLLEKTIKNEYYRIAFGGVVIILLSFVFSSGDYNGAGSEVIIEALHGEALPWACFVKLLFTAVTLGAGYKGGEIVPTLFIGATMGATLGNLMGMDPGFAAAISLIATFCGAVNCPIASMIMSLELFGDGGFVYFAVACAVSYTLSGYYSLYSSQKIVYSKTKAKYVNADTKQ